MNYILMPPSTGITVPVMYPAISEAKKDNAVVTSKNHPEIRNRYLALKKRRGHKKAIIAIARMMLTAIHNILKKNESYNPELYRKSDASPQNREVSLEQAVFILQRQGYIISQPAAV